LTGAAPERYTDPTVTTTLLPDRLKPAAPRLLLCLALIAVAPPEARSLSLAEGLAILDRAGRDAALAAAEEQVSRSAQVLAGAARRPSVDAFVRETMLAYQPRSLLDVQLGAEAGPRTIPVAEAESLSFGVRARQLLYDFGRTDAAVRAAALDTQTRTLEISLARNRAALRFILAYVRLLRADQLLALQRTEVTRLEAHRDDTRALLEEGTITENDLLQAEVRLADAAQRRLQAENQRALAAAQVNSLLARPLGEEVAPEEPPAPAPEAAPGLEEALAAAGRDRLELAQLSFRAASTQSRRAAVRAERLPQLFLAGGYEFTENRYQEHEGNWSVLAGVDLNLYSGGLLRERLLLKDRELAVLERAREQALDAVRLDVQEAWLSLGTARSRVDAAGTAIEQARENHRLQRLRYAEGLGTATEVLDAVSLATTAESNALNARYDVIDALARLDFAVGRELVPSWGGARTNPGFHHE